MAAYQTPEHSKGRLLEFVCIQLHNKYYESRTNRALVHNYFIARKYCVLSRYVANNYINVFPANTFFNDAYQTISDIQFIATGRVAPVTGYK